MQSSGMPLPSRPALLSACRQAAFAAGRYSVCMTLPSLQCWQPQLHKPLCLHSRRLTRAVSINKAIVASAELTSNLPAGPYWGRVQQWVVFSDLHVSAKTAQVCCQVLRKVRQEAEARNAGIIFLGDFWHARGSLPVVPLNLVLEEMRGWKQPTLMLVGNHDQVSLGGLVHGLTPLAAACPSVHVVDQPTVFLDALWLPYRREHREIEAALQNSGAVKAVFGHADVLGAFVNETFQARDGLEPSLFPHVPTYLGHYHKPHTVGETSIRYIGSPYQVSRSESAQQKELLILDSSWQAVGSVPMDLGPRHFNTTTVQPQLPADIRPGDRVRWTLPEGLEASDADAEMRVLQMKGVEVEVVVPLAKSAPRIEEAEDLGALALFQLYADAVAMSAEARAKGVAILEGLGDGQGLQLRHDAAYISFHRLRLEGYGPFREPVEYDLAARGLRVVSGRNEDDTGADSNGAGKSALVMAALWCLTGRSDTRTLTANARGLTGAEIVNDDSKLARVQIEGTANEQPFTVERSVRRRGLAGLRFVYGGEDLTGADSRLTQAEMDSKLACQLLTRVVFHSQSDIAGLLEADDKEFKSELGRIVEMDPWDNGKLEASEQLRAARNKALQVEQELIVRTAYLSDLQAKCEVAHNKAQEWEASMQQQVFEAEDAFGHATMDMLLQLRAVESAIAALQLLLDAEASDLFVNLEEAVDEAAEERGRPAASGIDMMTAVTPISKRDTGDAQLAAELRIRVQSLLQRRDKEHMEVGSSAGKLQSASRQLEEYLSLQSPDSKTMVCDRCLQPINHSKYTETLQRLKAEVAAARQAWQQTEAAASCSQEEADTATDRLRDLEQKLAAAQLQAQQQEWRKQSEVEAQRIEKERRQKEADRNKQAAMARRSFAESILGRAESLVKEFKDRLASLPDAPSSPLPSARASTQPTSHSLDECTQDLMHAIDLAELSGGHFLAAQRREEQLRRSVNPHLGEAGVLEGLITSESSALQAARSETSRWQEEAAWLKEVDAAFGRTGIQSFALEGVLGELQRRTAYFLEQLSSGTTLALSASRPPSSASKGKDGPAVERITKAIHVRSGGGAGDAVRERSVRQLSGGERRRVALALALGFADLISARARLRCDLLVLDEVLQQLDEEGCARMAQVLRRLPQANILIVGQADSYITQVFDKVDIVVKRNGCASLEVM